VKWWMSPYQLPGLEKTTVVGLAQAAVKESIERVRRAALNSGFPWNAHTLLINLAPEADKVTSIIIDNAAMLR